MHAHVYVCVCRFVYEFIGHPLMLLLPLFLQLLWLCLLWLLWLSVVVLSLLICVALCYAAWLKLLCHVMNYSSYGRLMVWACGNNKLWVQLPWKLTIRCLQFSSHLIRQYIGGFRKSAGPNERPSLNCQKAFPKQKPRLIL